MRARTFSLLVGAACLVLMAVLTVTCIAPPEVRGEDAPATEFSAARAWRHVQAIAATPHPVGSRAHEDVRAYLLAELGALHLETRVQETSVSLKAAGITHAARVKNVIARLPGKRSGPAVMLAAHYDSVPESRGASDDGSGVATLLETARALTSGPALDNDVLFLFSDAEEVAACGALAFTEEELARQPIGVALNFEARGTRGAVALYDTSDDDAALIRAVSSAAPRVVSNSLLAPLARALPNDSDASVFKRAGVPTLAFAYVDHLYQYHQYTDSVEALDLRSLQHDGDYALPLARYFGKASLPLDRSPSVVYFDVFGRRVIAYSTFVARGLTVVTLALFVALFRWANRQGLATRRGAAAGLLLALGAVVAAVLAGGLAHLALGLTVDRFALFANPPRLVVPCLLFAGAALLLVYRRSARDGRPVNAVLGALGLWAFALLVVSSLVPMASFVFLWPLLFALGGTALWLGRPLDTGTLVTLGVCAALVPAAFFWSGLGYSVYATLGERVPEVVVLAFAFPMLLALPLLESLGGAPLSRLVALAAALGVLATLFAVVTLHRHGEIPRPDTLEYSTEKNGKSSKWTTTDPDGDSFVAQHVPHGHRWQPAPSFDIAPLEVQSAASDEGGARHSTLRLISHAHARCLRVYEMTQEPIAKALIDDHPVAEVVRFSAEVDEKIARYFLSDGPAAAWVMEYCGADERGFKLELFSPAAKPLKLRIVEVIDGLPGPPLRPRLPSESYPDTESDITLSNVNVTL